MDSGKPRRLVNVCETIWGIEIRIVLRPEEAQDFVFCQRYGPPPERLYDLLAGLLGERIRDLAWNVAGGVQVFPTPLTEGTGHGPNLDRGG